MATFYDLCSGTFERVLDNSIGVMEKSQTYLDEQGIDLEAVVNSRLVEDMLPFSFQILMLRQHSIITFEALMAGEFNPPTSIPENDYAGHLQSLRDARAGLANFSEDDINAAGEKSLLFKMNSKELPFTGENFVLSFTFPNLYFHATTLYNLLRLQGVPLGKTDFLAKMAVGLPS